MQERRTAEDIARLLRDLDRDLAKGLTIPDICRKVGIAETTYYRWRERRDPARIGADRRCSELESEVGRLERLVAELMLGEQMPRNLAREERRAPTGGGPRPITRASGIAPRSGGPAGSWGGTGPRWCIGGAATATSRP